MLIFKETTPQHLRHVWPRAPPSGLTRPCHFVSKLVVATFCSQAQRTFTTKNIIHVARKF